VELGLDGKVAFVAASTGGLGWATAAALAGEGCRVAVTGRRGAVARERAAELDGAVGIEVDVTDPGSLAHAVATVRGQLGEIDVLVLNSGGPPLKTAMDLDPDDLVAATELLVLPHQRLVRATVPGMRERGWGRVVAIGSSGVQQPIADLALSNAARGALAGLLKTLAGEVAADGVTVNMVLPGRIATARVADTDATVAARRGVAVEEVAAAARANIPAGRYGEPAEFGAVAAFLCSQPAAYVTGSQVRVDGGLIAAL
jgi:3-oxoacyl-[acyl-carrier protein] reductase